MATLHLHVLESTDAFASNLPATGLQARDMSVGMTLEGTPDEVLSAFLEYFGAVRDEELRIEIVVDRRSGRTARNRIASTAIDQAAGPSGKLTERVGAGRRPFDFTDVSATR